jgi:hypothetical protein
MSLERIISTIEALPAPPHEVDAIAATLIEGVEEGWIPALDTLLRLKSWARLHELVSKHVAEAAVKELEARGKDNVLQGYKVELHQPTSYDYSASPEWQQASDAEAQAAGHRKAIEAQMKQLKGVATVIDGDTGEVKYGAVPKHGQRSVKFTPLDRPAA